MYRFIAQTPRLSKISRPFPTAVEAKQFGKLHWQTIKRAGTRVCKLIDDENEITTLWVDPREIPEGYYGVDGKRYYVSRPSEGKWEGWTFLKTGSDYHDRKTIAMIKPDGEVVRNHDILRAICADPTEAAAAYGRITGTCRSCGRKLEDETSRAIGMGPICRKRWGL